MKTTMDNRRKLRFSLSLSLFKKKMIFNITSFFFPSSFEKKNSHQPLLDLPVQPAQVLDIRGPRGAPVLGQEAREGAGREEGRRLLLLLLR